MKTKLAGTMAAALAAGVVTAATVSNLASDDNSRNAYSTDSKWSGGKAPANDSTKAYDFVVANGYTLWIPESSNPMTFGGASLQLGNGTTKGNVSYKGDKRYLTFPDVRLYGGWFGQANNNWHGIAGNATVYSTAEAPFVFSTKGAFDTYFYLKLTGDETSAIRINASSVNNPFIPFADQSATYSGSWILGNNVYFRPQTNPGNRPSGVTGQNSTSAQLFGKPLTTFNPKALVLYPGVNFRGEITSGGMNFAATDNRGIWLEAEGGTVNYTMINGRPHQMSWPITGKGTFRVNGDGNFHLYSSCTVPLKADGSATKIYLRPGASATGGYSNTAGRPIYALFSPNGGTLKTVRVGGTIPEGQKLALGFTAQTNVTKVTDIPLVVIDKNVSRTLTEDDFDPWGVPDYQIVNADRVVFSTNEEGETVVSVRLFPYVQSKINPRLNDGSTWVGEALPTAGQNAYVIVGTEFRTGYGESDDNIRTAPGDRWVFGKGSTYVIKETKITFPFGRLLGGNSFLCGQSIDKAWELAGTIDLRQLFGDHVVLAGDGVRDFTVSANLSGNGAIWAQGQSRSYHWGDQTHPVCPHNLIYSGDNSGFKGTFFATNTSFVTGYPLQLKAASETNFGGNPEKFSANAWAIGHGVVFMPTADVTFDDENRGVTFLAGSFVNTTSGDFAIKTPVVFEGAFEKAGTGTFAFGAGGATFGTGAAIAVNAGALKAEGVNALKGAAVSFADGAVLAFDATVGAVDLTTTTLSKAGDTYLVRIDGLQEETAIATFASAQAAADFVANAKTVKGSAHKGYLFADGATVKAGVSGLTIIFR